MSGITFVKGRKSRNILESVDPRRDVRPLPSKTNIKNTKLNHYRYFLCEWVCVFWDSDS